MRISILQTDIVWENKQENTPSSPREVRNSSWNNGRLLFYRKHSPLASVWTPAAWPNLQREKPSRLCADGLKNTNSLLQAAILPAKQPRKEEIPPTTTVHSSLRPKQCLLLRQTTPLPDGTRNRAFHFRLPTSHYPVSRLEHTVACML